MSKNYNTVVVGTDGSPSSLLAVERAAELASAFGAKLVIGCAYYESEDEASSALRQDSNTILGDDTARENLSAAVERAKETGLDQVETAVRPGTPVEALMSIVTDYNAELLVVGNRGINSLTGRLLGSVPADVARQSDCDVMIVHTVS
ncbi:MULTISPECIES: universal stress protein [unclassified Corynebacterium]|uniref:universal stress protein n=1 Tax=unclassified Corynebacterium TaxID=2624378 RepID=UPI0021AA66C2|nr:MULTISPECIES: universal stress protein [unclassified Corynebacterium]MCT1452866.1 universal stress protein [Corynebacterium sp. p3-SID1145]MCT1461893.1 universal stress protein [Corynebacterium sp. p3-SID1140]MDN8594640.1 universal stress protein [Corynebacterium sp. P4_F2]WKK56153.1 universal stress protein [Corynebacterium sp. P4-C1]WKK63565.1 universal stress protein [Corynebacterium sp. P8-C1]